MTEGKPKAVRLNIEQSDESRAEAARAAEERMDAEGAPGAPEEPAPEPGKGAGKRRVPLSRFLHRRVPGAASAHAAREALADADESFTRYAQTHKNTVVCGLIGLVTALLIIFLGFWNTLLIVLFTFVGVIIGQALDGDNGIVNFFRRYFGGR